jgi:hypothetical protein
MLALEASAIRLATFLIGTFQNSTTTMIAIVAGVIPNSVGFNHKTISWRSTQVSPVDPSGIFRFLT